MSSNMLFGCNRQVVDSASEILEGMRVLLLH